MGAKTNIKHPIETGDNPPIKSKWRLLNPIIDAKVKERIDDLEGKETFENDLYHGYLQYL